MNEPQPQPAVNSKPAVWALVINDMAERDLIGMEKYNTRLQPFNGRDVLKDVYQESLDLVVYLRQVIYERDNTDMLHFPRLKFSDTNGLFKQIEHIESELKEVREAYVEPDTFHLAEEIFDVMVSSMTALRIIERTHGINICDVINYVHAKNRSRNYECAL